MILMACAMRATTLLLAAATESAFMLKPTLDAILPADRAFSVAPRSASRSRVCRKQNNIQMSGFGGGFGKAPPKNTANKKKGATKNAGSSASTKPPVTENAAELQQQAAAIDVQKVLAGIDDEQDPFWQLIEPLILSEFAQQDVTRVLGFIQVRGCTCVHAYLLLCFAIHSI